MNYSDHYQKAIELIDFTYENDTASEEFNGIHYPKEYLYALRMVEELQQFKTDATEAELLAARCQHLCRWEVPRTTYPMDRKGYHAWRTFLYTYQAEKAKDRLIQAGYNTSFIDEVVTMISKQQLKNNKQSQLIEDVVCIVFIKYYLDDFMEQHKDDEVKLIRIIHNTWIKMSDMGHEAALKIELSPKTKEYIKKALA